MRITTRKKIIQKDKCSGLLTIEQQADLAHYILGTVRLIDKMVHIEVDNIPIDIAVSITGSKENGKAVCKHNF